MEHDGDTTVLISWGYNMTLFSFIIHIMGIQQTVIGSSHQFGDILTAMIVPSLSVKEESKGT